MGKNPNNQKYWSNRAFKSHEKNVAKRHYKIIIGLIIASILFHTLIEEKLLYDSKSYFIYLFIMPLIVGFSGLTFYRRKFLLSKYKASENVIYKLFVLFFYTIQGLLFSYLSTVLFTNFVFNFVNKQVSNKSPTEIISCQITRIYLGRYSSIDFNFKNCHNYFRENYHSIKDYENEDLSKIAIEIKVKKGLLGSYVVENWRIKKSIN